MLECFGVFSEVIAFVCIGWQFAAVRTLLSSQRRIAADAASARANELGEPSIARFAPPTSRRGISEGPELSVSRPDGFSHGQPKGLLRFDSSSQTGQMSNPPHAGLVGANHLFAGVVLHQIRPRARSAAAPRQRVGYSRSLNPGPTSVPVCDAGPVFTLGSERSLTIAQAGMLEPPLASIETLLAELARRRLARLTAKKRA
jgi:hypothetical protein